MQGGNVAVTDGLLPAGMLANSLYGQIDLDEALGVLGHYNRNNISFEVLAPCGMRGSLQILGCGKSFHLVQSIQKIVIT